MNMAIDFISVQSVHIVFISYHFGSNRLSEISFMQQQCIIVKASVAVEIGSRFSFLMFHVRLIVKLLTCFVKGVVLINKNQHAYNGG